MSEPPSSALSFLENFCLHPEAAEALSLLDLSGLPTLPVRAQPEPGDRFQMVWDQGLALRILEAPRRNPLRVDFDSGRNAHRRQFGGGRQQDIARACGLNRRKDLTVLDATAGFGRDAFILASLGASVDMTEAHPVVALLLADGLRRARLSDDRGLAGTLARMRFFFAQSGRPIGESLAPCKPDVIYLDPMFPERRKSAAVKGEMQALHGLVGTDSPATQARLLQWALDTAEHRVVVKRPRLAPVLGEKPPTYRLTGKTNRFDVYAMAAFQSTRRS